MDWKIGGSLLKKKTVLFVFLCLFVLGVNVAFAINNKEVSINEDHLNLRSGPGTNYEKLGQLQKGEKYPFVAEQGDWVEIQLEEYSAWVSKQYVTIEENSAVNTSKEQEVETEKIQIPIDHTQIRNGPSTEYEIIYFAKQGEQLPVVGEENGWLKVRLPEGEGYLFKDLIQQNPMRQVGLKGKTIVIDPGHGGNDSGAISASGALEKDIAFKTADILAQELSLLGAKVIMTRNEETFVSLSGRATLANVENADAFISLHYNSVPNLPYVTGISTYYFQENYQPLAQYIQEEIIQTSGDRDRGIDFGDFQVLRQNYTPAVLIELGFISNPEIDQLLATNTYQKKLVSGMINGLKRYFAEY